MTATLPKLTEREFMDQVTQLAELRGWSWAHFRPAQTAKGWRTPVSGPLGKGWPDLVLVRPRDHYIIFAELKRDGEKPTPDQENVLSTLREMESGYWAQDMYKSGLWRHVIDDPSGIFEVYVWHPADWPEIERVLR